MAKAAPDTNINIIGYIEHPASGLTVEVVEHAGKRFSYTAAVLGYEFKASKREKLEQQVNAQLDQIAALEWTPLIEAYTRYTAAGAAFLSMDRYWVVQLPAGELLRANWRSEGDDNRARLARAYIANLPPGFGPPFPLVEKGEDRQRVYMQFSDAAWRSLQQSVGKLRTLTESTVIDATQAQSKPTLFMPPRITRYEVHFQILEKLIRDHLDIEYPILTGERWSPDSSNALLVSMDGYDDSDRAVVEQIRSGERCYYALEMLMRVLVEQHVLPEGAYLITARQE
jgi:hypothetical protein